MTNNINEIKESLIKACDENNRIILTYKEIENHPNLPNPKTIQERFINDEGIKYQQFLLNLGYKKAVRSRKFKDITYDDICALFEKWHRENGYYPTEKEIRKNNYLPNREVIKRVIGDRESEFRAKFKLKLIPKKEDYQEYVKYFIKVSKQIGRPLFYNELENKNEHSYHLPAVKWMINNCPDKSVSDYNSLLEYMGFKPRFLISKEMTIKYIMDLYKEKGNMKAEYFKIKETDDSLGITTINNHWGSFNNMLKELGFPINWEKQRHLKTYDEMKSDLKRLCIEIEEKENRKIISYSDIDECEYCFSSSMYSHTLKSLYNTTIREVIESIGYLLNDTGFGFNFRFDDGELVLSKYELKVSQYFRSFGMIYNKDYRKDVFYKTFIGDYNGKRTIDYVLFDKYYIEIAGVTTYKNYDVLENGKNHIKNYRNKLNEKIQMLRDQRLNYKIIYPEDMKTKSLEEIFSFLQQPTLQQ